MSSHITEGVGMLPAKVGNKPVDVLVIQALLNSIPAATGGPLGAGAVPKTGRVHCYPGDPTIQAIVRFQTWYFGVASGRVTPNSPTLRAMDEVASGHPTGRSWHGHGPVGGQSGGASAWSWARMLRVGNLRARIVEVAEWEATRPDRLSGQVNTVTTRDAEGRTVVRKERAGWQRVQEYFRVLEGWTWTPAELDKLKDPTRDLLPGGIHWCGIFATWVLNRAGIPVRWRTRVGPIVSHGASELPLAGFQDKAATVGDICILKGEAVHHVIPTTAPDALGDYELVAGNTPVTSTMRVVRKSHENVRNLRYYFRSTDPDLIG